MKTGLDAILVDLLRGESDLPEEATSLLYQAVEGYRRGGMGFTFKEWCALSPVTQTAFMEIGNKMRDQDAARVAYFMTQPMEMMKVLFGEEAAIKMALQKSMEPVAK